MRIKNIYCKCLAVILIGIITVACASIKREAKITQIGICTGYFNAEKMQHYGYSYVEEGVSKFLMPTKTEEEFDVMLKEVAPSPLPIKACNGFIPGHLKSVGPDAVPSEILEFVEVALRRAQKAGVEIIVFGSGGSRSIPDGFPREKARRQFVDLGKKMARIAQK